VFDLNNIVSNSQSTFDLIVSNPPFAPNPSPGVFHVAGDGGWLGTRVTDSLLRVARRRLAPHGTLVMTSLSLERGRYSFVLDLARRVFRSTAFRVKAYRIYPDVLPIRSYLNTFMKFHLSSEWASHLSDRMGFDGVGYIVLVISRHCVPFTVPRVIRRTSLSGSWSARLDRYSRWLSIQCGTAAKSAS
jgi:hypothetical protein